MRPVMITRMPTGHVPQPVDPDADRVSGSFVLRRGGVADVPLLMEMFDEAVAWLVERGSAGQWGSDPHSADPRRVSRITGLVSANEMWVAERDGRAAGILVVGSAMPYVPPPTEPELYVVMLVARRGEAARGAGSVLLALAADLARERGITMQRVDCYAGGDGGLVRYYESQGFTRAETFTVGDWPGQVLWRRVDPTG
jgi:GNAT superfamily N-acetyltransferase